MIQLMCVIVVAAYLLTRSKFFVSVLEGHPSVKIQIFLILFFGVLSIYGTMGGIEIMGAVINVRDLGPIVGGLVGGPVVGLGAGLPANAILDGILTDVNAFCGSAPQYDDITLMVIRVG